MAKDVRFITTCDPCDHDGMSGVPAVATRVLSINGGPQKEIDLCARDEMSFKRLFQTYAEHGREASSKEPAVPKRAKPSAIAAPKAKELEKPPPATEEGPPDKVWCPLPHNSENGKGKFITYKSRGQHAKQTHDGAQVWDIEWMDPHKILTDPCTVHAECMETGLAFESAHGLSTHIAKCPLPRIDGTDNEARDGTPDD